MSALPSLEDVTLALLADAAPPPRSRGASISVARLSKRALRADADEYAEELEALGEGRPQTYGDCEARGLGTALACPYLACKHHLYLDVHERTGSIKLNFPDLEPWDLPETCALAVANRGGTTLEDVGALVNLTRERVRQVELASHDALRRVLDGGGLRLEDLLPEGRRGA